MYVGEVWEGISVCVYCSWRLVERDKGGSSCGLVLWFALSFVSARAEVGVERGNDCSPRVRSERPRAAKNKSARSCAARLGGALPRCLSSFRCVVVTGGGDSGKGKDGDDEDEEKSQREGDEDEDETHEVEVEVEVEVEETPFSTLSPKMLTEYLLSFVFFSFNILCDADNGHFCTSALNRARSRSLPFSLSFSTSSSERDEKNCESSNVVANFGRIVSPLLTDSRRKSRVEERDSLPGPSPMSEENVLSRR
jgi:hypothetical protein